MDIFLMWSGSPSLLVAIALRDLLIRTIHVLRPFLSQQDIRMGSRWNDELDARLNTCEFAIGVLTSQNLNAPWIHFEAGAISRKGRETVTCLLVDVEEARYPLGQFQNTPATKEHMLRLLRDINARLETGQVGAAVLEETFGLFWPKFSESIEKAKETIAADRIAPTREDDPAGLLQELLAQGRATSKAIMSIAHAVNAVDTHLEVKPSMKELMVLQILQVHPRGLYGVEIVDKSERAIGRGSIYTLLSRLEEKGFVRRRQSTSIHAGLPRPIYSLTPDGQRAIAAIEIGAMSRLTRTDPL